MAISVFGLGYVGVVSCACLAKAGHRVVGIDISEEKVAALNDGKSPIVEEGVDDLVAAARRNGSLEATMDIGYAIKNSDKSLICVGTPSEPSGALNLEFVRRVSEEIGEAIRGRAKRHLIIYRSTMLPGSVEDVMIPSVEKASGTACGSGFGVAYNPEFLRESTSVYDFWNPPKTVVGSIEERDADAVFELYEDVAGVRLRCSIREAEMVKYVDNCFHAVKVTFGNEVGHLCRQLGIDSHRVMDMFVQDTKLNISSAYLKPGYAFGGSCLPKDLRAIVHRSKMVDLDLPLLTSVLPSNEAQKRTGLAMVLENSPDRRVGILGVTFKAGTDDVRESPMVEIVEGLLGKGFEVSIYDPYLNTANLRGMNKAFLLRHIPHIARLLTVEPERILEYPTIVLGNRNPEYLDLIQRISEGQRLIDLVRIDRSSVPSDINYQSIT
jgi:GDP-mannose 6-dehydrogenase